MRANRWMVPAAAGAVMLVLSGCGNDVRQALGMTKQSPDEFQVVAHAPLTLPPDYSLHPPQPGAPRSDSYEGDGHVIVRHPDTEVVTAAMKTVIETIQVQYG